MAESASISSDTACWSMIAAIDFGTSCSGYAYSKTDNTQDSSKPKIHVQHWDDYSSQAAGEWKAPTTVLFKRDEDSTIFGYEAEKKYLEICKRKEQNSWYYFRKFKMLLYDTKKICTDTYIQDEQGKSLLALDVFVRAISCLKKIVLDDITSANMCDHSIHEDILWVMTVPAIWSDSAKQFMRMAAEKAGILRNQLRLVLEPEAASEFCRQEKLIHAYGFQSFEAGFRYIVVDMGGGTVDIATHEVNADGTITELYPATGNGFGGIHIDKQCQKKFKSIFHDIFYDWSLQRYDKFIKFERKLELLKRNFSGEGGDGIHIPIPSSLRSALMNIKLLFWRPYSSVKEYLQKNGSHAKTSIHDDVLIMQKGTVERFYTETITHISSILHGILDKVENIKVILLVGGLASCQYIQTKINAEFSGETKVIIPKEANLAVLKGAVLLGNRPNTITGRIARFTYGIAVAGDFLDGHHRDDYKFEHEGKLLCDNVFETMIKKGELMKYGHKYSTTTIIRAKQEDTKTKTFVTYLYQSTKESPKYVTEESCTRLVGFDKKPIDGKWPDYTETTVEIHVGEAELKFFARQAGREPYETHVDLKYEHAKYEKLSLATVRKIYRRHLLLEMFGNSYLRMIAKSEP